MNKPSTKRCYICKQHKDISLFHKNSATRDGLCPSCKECKNKEARDYYRTPKGHKIRRAQANRWRAKNLDKHRRMVKEWKKNNPRREKDLISGRKWRKKNRDHLRWYRLRFEYGLEKEQYQSMYKSQKGRCAICGVKPKKTLHIDHDHKTGKVRGLLCDIHNQALGMFADNIEYLKSAIKYLRKNADQKRNRVTAKHRAAS